MAVKMRLARYGKKRRPFYKIVVANSTSPRDGRFIEIIGNFNPCVESTKVNVNKEKALYWLKKGAKPTQPVKQLLKKGGVLKGPSDNSD